MKQKTRDGKFTVEIKDGYLEGGKYTRKDGTANIKLFAEESSVTLYEVADAIKNCIFWGGGLEKVIDSNRFFKLNINLEIRKSDSNVVTYNFKIPNYQSMSDILPDIASNITI